MEIKPFAPPSSFDTPNTGASANNPANDLFSEMMGRVVNQTTDRNAEAARLRAKNAASPPVAEPTRPAPPPYQAPATAKRSADPAPRNNETYAAREARHEIKDNPPDRADKPPAKTDAPSRKTDKASKTDKADKGDKADKSDTSRTGKAQKDDQGKAVDAKDVDQDADAATTDHSASENTERTDDAIQMVDATATPVAPEAIKPPVVDASAQAAMKLAAEAAAKQATDAHTENTTEKSVEPATAAAPLIAADTPAPDAAKPDDATKTGATEPTATPQDAASKAAAAEAALAALAAELTATTTASSTTPAQPATPVAATLTTPKPGSFASTQRLDSATALANAPSAKEKPSAPAAATDETFKLPDNLTELAGARGSEKAAGKGQAEANREHASSREQAAEAPAPTAAAPPRAAEAAKPVVAVPALEPVTTDSVKPVAETTTQDDNTPHIMALDAVKGAAPLAATQGIATLRATRGPNAPMGVQDQVAVQIQKNVAAGNDRFTMTLRPDELGRIDIRLEINKNGTVTAMVAVDRPQTLELLLRDSRGMERALQDAGLKADAGSLSFSLRGEGSSFADQQNGQRGSGRRGGGFGNDAEAADTSIQTLHLAPGRVDVSV